ncbi:MAG TPA: phosphodiester glycosidase family protein [Candidatus Saccharimonadales bacterium]|nr:phosphodiester glycosidase family protein [Candidatus Saccharimonadales bacterium]
MKKLFRHIVKYIEKHKLLDGLVVFTIFVLLILLIASFQFVAEKALFTSAITRGDKLSFQLQSTTKQLQSTSKAYQDLKNQDQYKINQNLKGEITHIHDSYGNSIAAFQNILDLQAQKVDVGDMNKEYITIVSNLSHENYATADAKISDLNGQIKTANDKLQAALVAAGAPAGSATAPVSNSAPGSGFSQQRVQTDAGTFTVDIVAADLGSTRVIVDTASDSDCGNSCPVLSLGDYVARSGAYAGINGTYFCPEAYPSCAGKTNSFDLLVMNKNKHYFNSDNNVYSTNPAFIFSGGVRVVSQALQWGRDTGVDGVISNYPLLVSGGNVVYSDSPDPKFNSVGARGFVAHKGNTVFIGDVFAATMGDSAKVMKAMGMDDAMNLDEGGSTALWYGGYKAGPGRAIPNALLFVRR